MVVSKENNFSKNMLGAHIQTLPTCLALTGIQRDIFRSIMTWQAPAQLNGHHW
jgi:hypothetical protein